MKRVYLDHNATTPLHPLVREAMEPFLADRFGNPSSVHWAGRDVAHVMEDARKEAAALIGADPSEVHFTGSGSEGDNMAIRGVLLPRAFAGLGAHVVTSAVEHPAVYSTCGLLARFGVRMTAVAVDSTCMVNPDEVRRAMTKDTALVSIMLANNETGTINPIKEIAAIAHEHGALVHTDAVQAVGKIEIDAGSLGVDMLTASGHKFNAPKGVGFQYLRKGVEVLPLISGGHQEMGLRAGTENVAGIAALGKACALARSEMQERHRIIGAMREKLERAILGGVAGTRLNGHPDARVYNTVNISFRGIEGEALLAILDSAGIAVSTGSACSSETAEPSRVLMAMGMGALCARGAIRMSLGFGTTDGDIDYALEVLLPAARRLIKMSPVKD